MYYNNFIYLEIFNLQIIELNIFMIEPFLIWISLIIGSWFLHWYLNAMSKRRPNNNWDLFIMLDKFDRRYRALKKIKHK
jgi:hypothetical protein